MCSQIAKREYKVSILVWNIGNNSLGRAYMLAEALRPFYEVEIIGPLFEELGTSIWEPLKNASIPMHVFPGANYPQFLETLQEVSQQIDGDIILVCKPRLPSFQLGLMAKAHRNRPLILDIDDYELDFINPSIFESLSDFKKPYRAFWTSFAEKLIIHADLVIVSNLKLQEKYGGIVIPHARDHNLFAPHLYDREKRRKELGISPKDKIILFMGTPRDHKGLLEIMQAVKGCGEKSYKLCVIGTFPSIKLKKQLISAGGDQLILIPNQPFDDIAKNMAIADVVCLMQSKDRIISNYQFPAKAIDAVAMGIPLLSSPVPPLKPLFEQGLVNETGSNTLTQDLKKVLTYSEALKKERQKKRNIFIKEYSYQAISFKMVALIDRILKAYAPLPPEALSFIKIQEKNIIPIKCFTQPIKVRSNRIYNKYKAKEGRFLEQIKTKYDNLSNRRPWKWIASSALVNKNSNLLQKEKARKKTCKELKDIELKLFHKGFRDRSLDDLKNFVGNSPDNIQKIKAVRLLALYYASQRDAPGANRCLEIISSVKWKELEPLQEKDFTVLKLECYQLLDNTECFNHELFKIKNLDNVHADYFFAAANTENDFSERLKWINKAFSLSGVDKLKLERWQNENDLNKEKSFKDKDRVSEKEKITIIFTLSDSHDAVRITLGSILKQTWNNTEILIVNSCSNNKDKLKIVSEYARIDPRIKVFEIKEEEGKCGIYSARNMALQQATGEYITSVEEGTWLHPRMLEIQYKHMNSNPEALAVIPGRIIATKELKVVRPEFQGSFVINYFSAIMFNRISIMETIGYWDSVFQGADFEMLERIRNIYGDRAVVNISDGPLAITFKAPDEILNLNDFGNHDYYTGALAEYNQSAAHYHDRETDLYYDYPSVDRPFPAPIPQLAHRNSDHILKSNCDVVMVSDFVIKGGSNMSNLEEIKALKLLGLNVGLVHMPHYKTDPLKHINYSIRELIDGTQVRIITSEEIVTCDLMVLRFPPVLQERQRHIPTINANKINVIVNQTPMKNYSTEAEMLYDINTCRDNLKHYFPGSATWYPIGPLVREALTNYHSAELSNITLAEDNWTNIIDIKEWKREKRPEKHSKIRIGRHSRDDYLKWPVTSDEIRKIYPDSDEFEICILGGASAPTRIMGALPENWLVFKYGEIKPKHFLEQLDLFVYYTHPDLIESSGRVIIESMAVGVPVIMPEQYRVLFEEAAIYAKPDDVAKAINDFMSNDIYYEEQVKKAHRFIEANFSYANYTARLEKIMGRLINNI